MKSKDVQATIRFVDNFLKEIGAPKEEKINIYLTILKSLRLVTPTRTQEDLHKALSIIELIQLLRKSYGNDKFPNLLNATEANSLMSIGTYYKSQRNISEAEKYYNLALATLPLEPEYEELRNMIYRHIETLPKIKD